MYILTSSQMFRLMKNVSESMAGRVSIIHMLPLLNIHFMISNFITYRLSHFINSMTHYVQKFSKIFVVN